MAKQKNVYFFGNGKADGNAKMKFVLGGKGANLAEMVNLGIPGPPGFTISTDVCAAYYENKKKYPAGIKEEVEAGLRKLESVMKKKLGDHNDPLLVSVRSGAAASMPGMMDTILNLGMGDKAVKGLTDKTGNPRFAWDAYRRFIQMYAGVVMGVEHHNFEEALATMKKGKNTELDTDLDASDLEKLVGQYKQIVKKHAGKDFPQDPLEQLWGSINAVFGSWMNERAIKYRQLENIKGLKGTAVNIQAMVYGNFGEDSGTGVCFSRDPSTGVNEFYGEYLMNAQGEDVVAGIRTPERISTLEKKNPVIYKQLVGIKNKLEKHFKDMQDMEFTVQQGVLYILQTRNGKRAGAAAVKCAVDMVKEGLIDKNTAILRVTPGHLDQLLHPMIDVKAQKAAKIITKGLNASPGAACGRIVYTAKDAEAWHAKGEKVMMVRKETSPEDIGGMVVAQGILTTTGGMTSHAAVVARGMGTPCIVGAKGVLLLGGGKVDIGGKVYSEGDWITICGSSGEVFEGKMPLVAPEISKDMEVFLKWCDEVRSKSSRGKLKGFNIRTNADQPEDAKRAFDFGAEGIGLCRTEHMFFEHEKLVHFRSMIVAETEADRKAELKKIMPLQQKDFFGIFKAMEGRPVTIRLLDPPLHEFVPHTDEDIKALAGHLNIDAAKLKIKIGTLVESNPMLGHRGCRLAVTYPEIYDMQVEAIALAAVDCAKQKIPVRPEIMIPLIVTARELELLRSNAEKVLERVFKASGVTVPIVIGTMIETPRAAIRSARIANYADFFSFGTNDLTQMTYGFSRDDVASFLPVYLEDGILDDEPFQTIDQNGVGALIEHSIDEGRMVKPDLKIGICGEHGGDPASIEFCYRAGVSYVSCSPFRVPLARLAGAQAVLKSGLSIKGGDTANASNPATAKVKGSKTPVKGERKMAVTSAKPAAKKPAAKKPGVKKAVAKKAPAKKAVAKKAPVKKAVAKKAPAKKAVAKKAVAKKAPAKKAVAKKAPAKKAVAKKAPAKKAVAKKAPAKKAVAKKAPAKKAVAKKAPAKKAVAKKAPAK
ncbi:MAG: pyruvate, phosphate dikinase [Treponema sp.]|jgi:pyruvate,orthophosphate dikinase|nr:pyruvate, phosphate dikinase [Treponema sp.]